MSHLENSWKHMKLICTHKLNVYRNCKIAGIPVQGFFHDMSKFSPVEFCESVKYFTGIRSPIDNCKEINGYSMAWFHHRGRNKHHHEFWVDSLDLGGKPIEIPYKYAVELICDYIAAGQTYMGENFTWDKEYEWWTNKKAKNIKMHPTTLRFVDYVLYNLIYSDIEDVLNPAMLKRLYLRARGDIDS